VIRFLVLFISDVPAIVFAPPPLLDAIVVADQVLAFLAAAMLLCSLWQ
jgi:hypothetical protein